METTLTSSRSLKGRLKNALHFSPCTGYLGLDVALLLVVGALHFTVLPCLTRSWVLIDLMTPWLVTTFVAAKLPRAALLGLLGALILETHSAAPAGLYICAYWVILVALYLTRGTLSWRHAFPWLVTFVLSELWVIGFETFVLTVDAGLSPLAPHYLITQAVRLVLAVGIGLWLSQRFMATGIAEEAA